MDFSLLLTINYTTQMGTMINIESSSSMGEVAQPRLQTPVCPTNLSLAVDGFIPFTNDMSVKWTQKALDKIWTHHANSIPHPQKLEQTHTHTHTYIYIYIYIYMYERERERERETHTHR